MRQGSIDKIDMTWRITRAAEEIRNGKLLEGSAGAEHKAQILYAVDFTLPTLKLLLFSSPHSLRNE